jgi:hypothetical protein
VAVQDSIQNRNRLVVADRIQGLSISRVDSNGYQNAKNRPRTAGWGIQPDQRIARGCTRYAPAGETIAHPADAMHVEQSTQGMSEQVGNHKGDYGGRYQTHQREPILSVYLSI